MIVRPRLNACVLAYMYPLMHLCLGACVPTCQYAPTCLFASWLFSCVPTLYTLMFVCMCLYLFVLNVCMHATPMEPVCSSACMLLFALYFTWLAAMSSYLYQLIKYYDAATAAIIGWTAGALSIFYSWYSQMRGRGNKQHRLCTVFSRLLFRRVFRASKNSFDIIGYP